jgi:hypothetical protein
MPSGAFEFVIPAKAGIRFALFALIGEENGSRRSPG